MISGVDIQHFDTAKRVRLFLFACLFGERQCQHHYSLYFPLWKVNNVSIQEPHSRASLQGTGLYPLKRTKCQID